jgi:hypothetical protein
MGHTARSSRHRRIIHTRRPPVHSGRAVCPARMGDEAGATSEGRIERGTPFTIDCGTSSRPSPRYDRRVLGHTSPAAAEPRRAARLIATSCPLSHRINLQSLTARTPSGMRVDAAVHPPDRRVRQLRWGPAWPDHWPNDRTGIDRPGVRRVQLACRDDDRSRDQTE